MPNLPMQSDVRVGDRIVTSGLGERFPAGFPVAEVVTVDRPPGGAFMDVDALPLATLDRGREVLLVLEAPGSPLELADGVADRPDVAPEQAGGAVDQPDGAPRQAAEVVDQPDGAPEQAGEVMDQPDDSLEQVGELTDPPGGET